MIRIAREVEERWKKGKFSIVELEVPEGNAIVDNTEGAEGNAAVVNNKGAEGYAVVDRRTMMWVVEKTTMFRRTMMWVVVMKEARATMRWE